MLNCHAEVAAVGGSFEGCAEESCCFAIASATPTAAAWARLSVSRTEAGSGESDNVPVWEADGFSEDEASAVNLVSKVIIHQSKMIAAKTSPMPMRVIWRASEMLFIIFFPSLRGERGPTKQSPAL